MAHESVLDRDREACTSALFLYTFAFMLRQLLLLTLIAMCYLLYKNGHRAKVFLLGFLNFELVLVVEVCPLHHLIDHDAPVGRNALVAVQLCLELWDIASVNTTARPILPAPSPSFQRPSYVAVISALIARIGTVTVAMFRMGSLPSTSTNTMTSPGLHS